MIMQWLFGCNDAKGIVFRETRENDEYLEGRESINKPILHGIVLVNDEMFS